MKTTKRDIIDNIKLMCGDCIEILPTIEKESIDCIISDIPYQISKESNFSKGGGDSKKYGSISIDFGEWDKKPFDIDTLLRECFRVLCKGGTLIIFYDIFKMQTIYEIANKIGFKQPRIGFWNKTNAVPINARINYLSNSREYFICLCKNKKKVFNSYYDKAVYNYPIVSGNRVHPTQKPVSLMEDLIRVHTNEGDYVMDCTMGSGSTMVACANTNRKGIGIELIQKYYDIAVKRVNSSKLKD